MKIFVVNCGSSSLKYQLIDMDNESVLASGLCDRIGMSGIGLLNHKPTGKDSVKQEVELPDHQVAINLVLKALVDPISGVIESLDEIDAVGHRVLHGGLKFTASAIINEDVLAAIEEYIPLGPLHNPANLIGIRACAASLPNVPQVAVFDTAFHQTMPDYAYTYAIPYEYYEKYKIRKYGFHGTSHRYITLRAAEMLGTQTSKIVTCHLGNGSSCAAVLDGKCVDTSMGLTPLEGLVMGTRSGSIDPAILKFVCNREGITVDEMDDILNKKSGVLGISGISNDFRDLETEADNGSARAKLALDIFYYKVRTTIGTYTAALGGLDAIVFTAGVGENSATGRAKILAGLEFLGIEIDEEKNKIRGEEIDISTPNSKVRVLVIPTNEELMIALDTKELVTKN
jgi:acetate kinase